MTNITAILARTPNGVVGKDNKLPWYLPEDLKLFKQISSEYTNMVMGRNTYESLPGLLPGRTHIVLTKNTEYKAQPGVVIEHTVNDILNKYGKFIVIGGPIVLKQFMPYIERFYLSVLHTEHSGDAYFTDSLKEFSTSELKVYDGFTHYVMDRR